jgi:predicted metal-dependent HD superfamily phosphohydrolase
MFKRNKSQGRTWELALRELEKFGGPNLRRVATEGILQYRNSPTVRLYHDESHVYTVLSALFKITKPSKAQILAAIWNDAVYVPGAQSEDSNEIASSELLGYKLRQLVGLPACVELQHGAAELIMATTIKRHLEPNIQKEYEVYVLDVEEMELQDADLSTLALPFPRFINKQVQLIQEYFGKGKTYKVTADQLRLQSDFLQKFLLKKRIFRTDTGYKLYESQARLNITELANFCRRPTPVTQ